MIVLLSQQPVGVTVAYSEVAQLTDRSISVERVCEVLAELNLRHDDRGDTLDAWFADKIAPLSAIVKDEVRICTSESVSFGLTEPGRRVDRCAPT